MREDVLAGAKNRVLQHVARFGPGASSLRVRLHRWRGVRIGQDVWIGYDVVLETSRPRLITVGDRVVINMRASIIAHFHGATGVHLEDDAYVGPGAIILPNVRVGRGAVIAAGSVVNSSVPSMVLVRGNPARPVARCGVPLNLHTPITEFMRHLRPLGKEVGR
jgi:acetyltransferase-like isoleucine patch superfamily enzyme